MAYSALGQGLLRLAGMAGKYGQMARPVVGKVVSKLGVPAAVGTVVGGVRGGQTGGPGGIIPGALGGGMTGGGLGLIPGVGGLNPYLHGGLGTLGGFYGPASMGVTGNVAQAGLMAGNQQGNVALPGNPNTTNVSGQHGGMMQMPDGSVWQQVNPGGYQQGIRFGSGLDTDQNISNQNKWYQAQLPQWDEIERRKQSRAIQNAQISSNIALARQLAGNRQIADLNIAQDANRSMGSMFANTAVPTLAM